MGSRLDAYFWMKPISSASKEIGCFADPDYTWNQSPNTLEKVSLSTCSICSLKLASLLSRNSFSWNRAATLAWEVDSAASDSLSAC